MSKEGMEPRRPDDKVTFGPSTANKDVLEDLVDQGYFQTSLGAFQAAAMLALRKKLDPSTAASGSTTWNRGSVPREILDFLEWYVPTPTPARVLEQLGNVGVAYIAERVKTKGWDYSELFDLPRDLSTEV